MLGALNVNKRWVMPNLGLSLRKQHSPTRGNRLIGHANRHDLIVWNNRVAEGFHSVHAAPLGRGHRRSEEGQLTLLARLRIETA